eukprot:scaffold2444_cov33-Phaeocystis_antarctica.AAC.1
MSSRAGAARRPCRACRPPRPPWSAPARGPGPYLLPLTTYLQHAGGRVERSPTVAEQLWQVEAGLTL